MKLKVVDRSKGTTGTMVQLMDDSGFAVWDFFVSQDGKLRVRNNETSLAVVLDCSNTLYLEPRP